MVDRSYLPFQSAREHQDRGMMKWIGFFLSEHTTSLGEEKHKVNFSDELTLLGKLTLISQLYAGQLKGYFDVKQNNQKSHLSRTGQKYPRIRQLLPAPKLYRFFLEPPQNCNYFLATSN
ncbi:hypothetical protein AB3329_00825 [Streptococcus sp. H31]|uniref:hypothetical protein n=1 Tax=Streptococcus huangxiaojuni TaxID=3237239 RepID=UPI0034A494AA